MFQKTISAAAIGFVLLSLLSAPGCYNVLGPSFGLFSIPLPVSPYFQKKLEDKAWDQERYAKVPVLGPIQAGGPAIAMDPPSDDEVMRALEDARPLQGGFPLLHEIQRNNVRIVKNLIDDSVDPPRVYPLIGPAQLHHARYKCTIYYTEVTRVGWPIPYTTTNEDAQEVVYIDHDHFHMVGNVDAGPGSEY
jgi:hypothetical protein